MPNMFCVECHTVKNVSMRGDWRRGQTAICDKCYIEPAPITTCDVCGDDDRYTQVKWEKFDGGDTLCGSCAFVRRYPSDCRKCLEEDLHRPGGIMHDGRELCSPCYFEIVVAKVKSMPA